MTYMQAALTVLAHADRPLTIPEITAVAVAEGLIHPRGRTPDRTMSSVLYRRMAADPDAPVFSRGGRVWVRGRMLPEHEAGYLSRPARRAQRLSGRGQSAPRAAARRISVLPAPPLRLPDAVVQSLPMPTAAGYAPLRREHAVARGAERGARLMTRLASRRAAGGTWDASQTATRLVAPLLAHLGYRAGREAITLGHVGRGRVGYLLQAGGEPVIALDVWRLGHDLGDDDAWHVLAHAQEHGAPYGAVTNGLELRLYASAMAEAQDSIVAAHVLTLSLDIGSSRADQAQALWLLARRNVAAGALDSYAANRAVGGALLDALEDVGAGISKALVAEVRARLGVALPAQVVLRHARLALRGQRGLAGEPLAQDVAIVSSVRGPRLVPDASRAAVVMSTGAEALASAV